MALVIWAFGFDSSFWFGHSDFRSSLWIGHSGFPSIVVHAWQNILLSPEVLAAADAVFNASAVVLLLCGLVFIKRRQYRIHAWFMCSALAVSVLFIACYLTNHALYGEKKCGLSPGMLRNFYLFIVLLPHVLLATVMVPLILGTLYLAWRRNWHWHPKLARPTLWVWLYVSVTGVMIYWMLYHWFPLLAGRA